MRAFGWLGLVVGLAVAGCSAPPNFLGTWTGTTEIPKDNPAAKMLQATDLSTTLTITEDKKFTMKTGGIGMDGVWEQSGTSITMRIGTVNGLPIDQLKEMARSVPGTSGQMLEQMDKPIVGVLAVDGTLTFDGSSGAGAMKLTRSQP